MNLKRFLFLDKRFILFLFLLCAAGLVLVASAGSSITSDPFYYMKKQLIWMLLGAGLAIIVMLYDYGQTERYWKVLYGIAIFLLTWVTFFGVEQRGTTGWIKLGPLPITFQPAELTKILLIISFANFLQQRQDKLETFSQMVPAFAFAGVPFLLVASQPDLGTALAYVSITVFMMFVAGANPKILWSLVIGGFSLAVLALVLHFQLGLPLPLEDYQLRRFTVFLSPYEDGYGGRGSGWNTIQSLIAVGSGGFWGKGLFQGTQVQLNFLPEHHTDFIFSVLGEELGFVGAALVILLYGLLLWRALVIARQAPDLKGMLIIVGITAVWIFHIYESIGMCLGIMPITGIPLPFLSYGGSSMLTNFISVGFILSVNIREKPIVF
jgi:rod shape determining protein RodA